MPRFLLLTILALLPLIPAGTPPSGTWQPVPGTSWQWQLAAAAVDPVLPVAVYGLDGEETDAATIARLRHMGIRTICYVNVGAWEEWRPDADDFPAEVIGEAWHDWEGERFLDIRRIDLLASIMEARIDACAHKGFDAIEPDNMDGWSAVTGFPLVRDDALAYARWLANTAHARGLAIGQKNAPDLADDLVEVFDFAITEDCAADGWCDDMLPYLRTGKAVFATEYADRTSPAAFQRMCADPALKGFSLILKHRELDAWREGCG